VYLGALRVDFLDSNSPPMGLRTLPWFFAKRREQPVQKPDRSASRSNGAKDYGCGDEKMSLAEALAGRDEFYLEQTAATHLRHAMFLVDRGLALRAS
jgi:hypothetical protein